ncbi:MAG TPA: hypothetical protein VHG28_13430 [Longimicrobiaceae bacterium]|nr:hypothetical protein [Longimicrobiaceae bacterium]
MLRNASYFLVLAVLLGAPPAPGQALPDTVGGLLRTDRAVAAAGVGFGARIWPGFRPDTIATHYVIPNRAKLLVRWPGELPQGFSPLPGVPGAGWADTLRVSFPRGRPIAFLSVDPAATPAAVVGVAVHEAFHAHEESVRRSGRRFGRGEDALHVVRYPVFDVQNEAAFALEARLLRRALDAPSRAEARRLAGEFLVRREARQARLDPASVEFEKAAELHEGLAQYTLPRGVEELSRGIRPEWSADAARLLDAERALLDRVLTAASQSVRRRFYATGSVMGLLLDRLTGGTWKERVVTEDRWLQEVLADVVADELPAARSRSAREDDGELARLTREAAGAVSAVRARRGAQRDSLLSRPGTRVVLDPSGTREGRFQWCGFDPQNVLPTGSGQLLHTRFLRVCGGEGITAELDQPVVEEQTAGSLHAVVGEGDSLRITAAGRPVPLPDGGGVEVAELEIRSPTLRVRAPRAVLIGTARRLLVVPLERGLPPRGGDGGDPEAEARLRLLPRSGGHGPLHQDGRAVPPHQQHGGGAGPVPRGGDEGGGKGPLPLQSHPRVGEEEVRSGLRVRQDAEERLHLRLAAVGQGLPQPRLPPLHLGPGGVQQGVANPVDPRLQLHPPLPPVGGVQ